MFCQIGFIESEKRCEKMKSDPHSAAHVQERKDKIHMSVIQLIIVLIIITRN